MRHFMDLGGVTNTMRPALEMTEELRQLHRVEDAVRRHAALARHLNAPMHVIQLANGVGVGINAEDAAARERHLVPAPVQIEAPRMRVDFNGDAVLAASLEDLL